MCTCINRSALGERLEKEDFSVKLLGSVGSRQMTFSTHKNKRDKLMNEKIKEHREERKKLMRHGIRGRVKSNFYKSKRK